MIALPRLPLVWPLLLLAVVPGSLGAQPPSRPSVAAALEETLVGVIAGAEKSVVAIARVKKPPSGEIFNRELRPDPLNLPRPNLLAPNPADPNFIPNDFATGVVVDPDGLILTAYHALGEDSDYYVALGDHQYHPAWIKAADPRADLAVLAIDANGLTPISLGDGTGVRKGQIVIVLGNPYAIARDGQVSAGWGIVSNMARKSAPVPTEFDTTGKTTLHHFGTLIQTDAKLNLGTSGGPLLDLQGRMVGLVTSLAAVAGYETAAGYAFPVDEAFRRAVDTLKQGREVEYGFLGVQTLNLSLDETLAGLQGTRVRRIVPGTPAEKSGMEPGDLVTAVNGKPVYDSDGLVLEVGRLPVESVVHLAVLRGDRHLDLKVGLTKYPVRGKKIVTAPAADWRGMRVDYPTAVADTDTLGGLEVRPFDAGVVATEVEENSPTWTAGLRPGCLVHHVDRQAVQTPKQFHAAVLGKQGDVRIQFKDGAGNERAETVAAGL
jgi:serine protease Do